MKKWIFSLLFFAVLFCAFVFTGGAAIYDPGEVDAEVVYMVSLDNDAVVVDINSDVRVAPASLTKIVTAIVTIENCDDFDALVTVPSYTIRLLDGTNSSTAGILVGEELTVRQLLYCLMVSSANDAANVLADYIGGGNIEKFVGMMNDFTASLGCLNTHFVNAHGLDAEGHYSTAKDLEVIYRYCLQNAMFCELTGTYEYEIPPTNKYDYTRYLRTTNYTMNPGIPDYYFEYVKNGKTGTTDDAGRCLISSASNDGYNYLCIVMKAKFYDVDEDGYDENMAFYITRKLYKWAYDNLRLREVANPAVYVTETEVKYAKKYDYVSLVPATTVTALVPLGVNADSVLYEPLAEITKTSVIAPVKKGDVLGRTAIRYAGQTIAEVDLVAAFDVQRSPIRYFGYLVSRLFGSLPMKILLIVVFGVALPLFLILFFVRRYNNMQAQKNRKQKTARNG